MFVKVAIVVVLLNCLRFELSVASRGKWKQHYDYQFPYEINGKHYFFAQSIEADGHNYFIQELNPGGKMGDEIANGFFKYHYPTMFPYSVDGKQYFFGQSKGKNYFTQELLPDGRLAKIEKANGFFNQYYEVMFPFSIRGRQFFYGQSSDGNNYFVQELYGDGTLADHEVTQGRWQNFYDIQFPFTMNGRHYFYGQSKSNLYYFIQEINDDGTLGKETDNGFLSSFATTQFPFVYENTQFIYIEDDGGWYHAEISPAAILQPRSRVGDVINHHDFPFTIGGELFFYGQNSDNHWIINKIVMCVKIEQLDRRHYSDFRLASWNMQGANSDGENKWVNIVRGQMDNYDIIALQESGAYPQASSEENLNPSPVSPIDNEINVNQRVWHHGTLSRENDVYIYHVRNGNGNDRVSMAIVSRRPADEVIALGPVGGASRPILGIRRGNDYFFNIHAGAHQGNEVPPAVRAIENYMSDILERNSHATWIIMGDYNRDGTTIRRMLFPTPQNVRREFSIPNRNTHHSTSGNSRILDFAITGAGVDNHQEMIAQASDPTLSDHSFVPFVAAFLYAVRPHNVRRCG